MACSVNTYSTYSKTALEWVVFVFSGARAERACRLCISYKTVRARARARASRARACAARTVRRSRAWRPTCSQQRPHRPPPHTAPAAAALASHLEVLLVRAVRVGVGVPLLDRLLVAGGLKLALEVACGSQGARRARLDDRRWDHHRPLRHRRYDRGGCGRERTTAGERKRLRLGRELRRPPRLGSLHRVGPGAAGVRRARPGSCAQKRAERAEEKI